MQLLNHSSENCGVAVVLSFLSRVDAAVIINCARTQRTCTCQNSVSGGRNAQLKIDSHACAHCLLATITAIYPTLSVALELEAQSKYRLCNPHFVPRGPPCTGCATCISFPRGNEDSLAFSTNFRTKSTFRSIQFSLIFSA